MHVLPGPSIGGKGVAPQLLTTGCLVPVELLTQESDGVGNEVRTVALATSRVRGEERGVGLHEDLVDGGGVQGLSGPFGVVEGEHPGKRQPCSVTHTLPGQVGTS